MWLFVKKPVTCKFNHLQSAKQSLEQHKEKHGDYKIPPNRTVQIYEEAHCRAEQGPVKYGEQFEHKDPELRLARWNYSLSRKLKILLPLIEGTKPLFLLLPAPVAPELQVLLGHGEGVYRVAVHVEVNLLGEVPEDEMLLGLRNVVRVRHRDVVDRVEVLT